MALTLLPTAAMAEGETASEGGESTPTVEYVAQIGDVKYDTLQAAVDAASRKATVKLLADTKENVTISTPYVTLDLNGHTLNGSTGERKPALTITARVTVKDSSEGQTGTIMREDTAENSGVSSHYVIDVQGDGWLTFESGTVKNGSGAGGTKGASLVRVGDDSVAKYPGLNIKGGTFTQDNFIVIKVDRGDLFLNGGTLESAHSYAVENWFRATIKGGTVNGAVSSWTYSGGSNSTLEISGGTVNGNVESVSYDGAEGKLAKVEITGGTVNGTLIAGINNNSTTDPAKATIEVTSGTFKNDPSKYVVENSSVTNNSDGTFGVAKAYLAKVGETSYYTMDDAFKAQTASGEAIVLLRDYTTGSTFNSGTVARTVDLNGHTWTCTGTDANSAAFEINNPNASLTVKNGKIVSSQLVGLIPSAMGGTIMYDNSSITFENVEMTTTATSGIETNGNNTDDSVTLKNSTLNVPNGFGIYFPSSGTLTIDNSTINAKTMGVQVCAGSLNINDGSKITVNGDAVPKTESDGAIQDGAAISIVNRDGYKGLGKIEVTGGTFTAKSGNAAIKAYKWDNDTKTEETFTESTKVSVSGGTFSSNVEDEYCAPGFVPKMNDDGTYGVKIKEDMAAEVLDAQGNTVAAYDTLAAAITAAKNGETITLLKNAELPNAEYYINKSVTINGSGKISCTVKAGEGTRAFVVENNGSLTLDGVELDIQGTKNTDTAKKNDGTGIDVQYGGSLILKNRAVLNLHDLERGTISSKPDGSQANPGQFVIDNSTFNSTNIDGNVANGGDWKVTNGSVDINTCGSYGLSVDSLTTEQSTVNVSGTGYSAIYGKKLQFNDGSNVLISGAGTKLPLQSQWSDARSPIQTDKNGGTIVVDSGATVTVQGCVDKNGKANDTIYLPKNTTYTNNGTVNATIITDTAPEGSCVVTLVSDGKTIGVQTVAKDSKFALPAAPEKNNYTFKGWSDGSTTYKAGDEATITENTTFTAQWSYNGSSSGGGSSSSSRRYDVSAPSVKHGDVTVSPKTASKGDTVTITVKPDSGYELDTLTVKDASGSKIKVKDKGDGKFTFTMPASKVTVSAEFAEIETLDFADVSTDAYYYEAVKWAAKKGITGGTGDGTFNPNGSCTRAHIVTFLWRAAGSPEPKSTVSFADVPAGSYYAKAVAWAVENGITLGTGDGTFSPNATCTRAQSVTFLYRALGTAPTTVNGFTDVAADAFYADAVAWAVESGVTNGTSASTFSPNNGCTRAQIVTFLYRTMK